MWLLLLLIKMLLLGECSALSVGGSSDDGDGTPTIRRQEFDYDEDLAKLSVVSSRYLRGAQHNSQAYYSRKQQLQRAPGSKYIMRGQSYVQGKRCGGMIAYAAAITGDIFQYNKQYRQEP